MSAEALNPRQFHDQALGIGKGHYFEPETEGSRWCKVCGHHDSVTAHPRRAK